MHNLWVDDEREPPPDWGWAVNTAEAIEMLAAREVEHLSLDYVLGHGDTADKIMYWLKDNPKHWPTGSIQCHSRSLDAQRLIEQMVKDFAPT